MIVSRRWLADYVPLPENAVKSIEASWKGIQGSGM